jgi:hypothetical protein
MLCDALESRLKERAGVQGRLAGAVRYPSYTGAILIVIGMGLALRSWGVVKYSYLYRDLIIFISNWI